MVRQINFANVSVNLSYTGKEIYLVAIAPGGIGVDYIIYNDKMDTLVSSGNLSPGTNGAEDLFHTGGSLYYATIGPGDIGLEKNRNYNVVIHYIDGEGVPKLNQYNFIFQPNIQDIYGDSPAITSEVRSTYIGNQMIEFYKATEDNPTRGVTIGDLDHITYKVKYDTSSDWKAPVSEQTQYVWYFPDGKVEYRKESD